MAGFYVVVAGQKSQMVGSFRGSEIRSASQAEGQIFINIQQRRLCREGTESLIIVPTGGVNCSVGTHKIKAGNYMIDLGVARVCQKHLHLIPTISNLKDEYSTKYFQKITFNGEPIDNNT